MGNPFIGALESAEKKLKYAMEKKDDLDHKVNQTYERWNAPHVIIQRGFGLTDTYEGDRDVVSSMLIGSKKDTDSLMNRLKESPKNFPIILSNTFINSQGFDFHHHLFDDMLDNIEFYRDFQDGKCRPFSKATETRIFDYRVK